LPSNTLLVFGLFAIVSSITPGPNDLMLLASGWADFLPRSRWPTTW